MKYNQPHGITDANAPYIDGNPDTGTQGSIPSAASIEFDQRELVNLITDVAAVAPTNADLHQVGKSLQSGKLNYGVDIGVVNAMIVPLSPVPDAYYGGMTVKFRAKFAPTAATTLDCGHGTRSVVKSGGAVLKGAEWSIGDIITVIFDDISNQWQLPPSPIAMLYGARNYYVSAATGLDTNDGLTAGTAFKTLQKAQDTTALFNLNGYNITIFVADGTYTAVPATYPATVECKTINGAGTINYQGNLTTPSAVVLSNSAGPAIVASGRGYSFRGFKVTTTGSSPGWDGAGVYCSNGNVFINNIDFGSCVGNHILCDNAGQVSYFNNSGVIVSGGCGNSHILSVNGSYVVSAANAPPTLNITAPVTMGGAWARTYGSGIVYLVYGTITGGGNVTGKKYDATSNGVINVNGGGVNAFPGTVAGTTATGGQYV